MNINGFIDHTLLKATATLDDIDALCAEALEFDFKAVCVNSVHVYQAKQLVKESEVKVASVIGFPLGANTTDSKIFEVKQCVADGADEIDMVMNLGWLKSGRYDLVEDEVSRIKRTLGNRTLKVILEMCYLDASEKMKAIDICNRSGADFIKTSTGFGSGGATYDDVELMNELKIEPTKIKASGGIRDKATAMKYIQLGASRIGTSSGVAIMKEVKQEE